MNYDYINEISKHKNGSPFDRGAADSYYHRPRSPHYWPDGTHRGTMVAEEEMSEAEIAEYNRGYELNEECGSKKEY